MVKTLSSLAIALLVGGVSGATHAPVWQSEMPRANAEPAAVKLPLYNIGNVVYYANMHFGSPPQLLRMTFDTLDSDVGVVALKKPGHKFYNHSVSSTYTLDGRHAKMRFNQTGVLVKDRITLQGDVAADDQYLVEITDLGDYDKYYKSFRFDGWFGIGANDTQSVGNLPSVIHSLFNSGVISEPCLGISMPRDKNGFVLFGRPTEEPVSTIEANAHPGKWGLEISKITIGDKALPMTTTFATLDTLNIFIVGPRDGVDAIAKAVGGEKLSEKGFLYSVRCDAAIPDLSFWSAGPDAHASFTISKEELIGSQVSETDCLLMMLSDPDATEWTLGLSVFHSYYFGFCWNPTASSTRLLVSPQI